MNKYYFPDAKGRYDDVTGCPSDDAALRLAGRLGLDWDKVRRVINGDVHRWSAEARGWVSLAEEQAATKAAKAASDRLRFRVKALARKHSIPLDDEATEFDRIAVWAPDKLDSELQDRFYGDHYVYEWPEALKRVEAYVEDLHNLQTQKA